MTIRKKIALFAAAAGALGAAIAFAPSDSATSLVTAGAAGSSADTSAVVAAAGPKFDYQRLKSMLEEREPMTLDDLHDRIREVVGESAGPALEQLAEQERRWDQVREEQQRVHARLATAIRASSDRQNDPAIAELDGRNNELLDELATATELISALTAEVTAMYEEAMYAQLDL